MIEIILITCLIFGFGVIYTAVSSMFWSTEIETPEEKEKNEQLYKEVQALLKRHGN
jgi:hypothetical protein